MFNPNGWNLVDLVQLVDFCISLKNENLNERQISNDEIMKVLQKETNRMIAESQKQNETIIKQNEMIISLQKELLSARKEIQNA